MADAIETIRDSFKFLRKNYGFSITKCSTTRYDASVTYMNDDCGVAVVLIYEFRESLFSVIIYRLIDGEMRRNTYPITDDSEVNYFDFADVLPEDKQVEQVFIFDGKNVEYNKNSPCYGKKNWFPTLVREYSSRLKEYGGKLLRGDFSEMPEVRKRINRRIEEYERKK